MNSRRAKKIIMYSKISNISFTRKHLLYKDYNVSIIVYLSLVSTLELRIKNDMLLRVKGLISLVIM